MKTDKNKTELKTYKVPHLQIIGKLVKDTQGGNSTCTDGPTSTQQCMSGMNG